MSGMCRILLASTLIITCAGVLVADYKVDIGYSALQARLGGATPTGNGVFVAQIEFSDTDPDNNTFLPNTADPSAFNNLPYVVTNRSGGGSFSGHATGAVGGFFYGKRSIAEGIRNIDSWRADNFLSGSTVVSAGWLEDGLLRSFSPNLPLVQTARVESHAYVATASLPTISELLRRTDFMIRRDNVVSIVGTNVNAGAMPPLLSSAYNVITVGMNPIPRSDLPNPWTSIGPTTVEVAGRSKPDIVVPADNVQIFPSNSTGILAGASALLVETATAISPNAARTETIKAVLLTGATTEEFSVMANPWTRFHNGTFREPLDRRFGAGELNINNSHRLLTTPEQEASNVSTVNRFGWDYDTINQGQTKRYFLDIVNETVAASITASWLRLITTAPGPNPEDPLVLTPSLVNIDIRLFNASGFVVGTMIDESISPIDNVEHMLVPGLGPGRYVIEVTADGTENFALAWDFRTVPEPATILLGSLCLFGAGGLGYWRWRRRKLHLHQELTCDSDQ